MQRVGVWLGVLLLAGLASTWRWRFTGLDHLRWTVRARRVGRPMVAAFLHGRLLPLSWLFARPGWRPWAALVSASRDGDIQAAMMEALGYRLVRGSSGRGGVRAMVEMLRLVRREPDIGMAIAVDGGSRGPRGRVKPGVLMLAQRGGGMVLPTAASARSALVLPRSWDHFLLPLPGACIRIHFGRPLTIRRGDEADRLRLEGVLEPLHQEADRASGLRLPGPIRAPERRT